MNSIDMTELLLETYKLADRINESEEVKQYLKLKKEIQNDKEAQRLIREFQRKKEVFEDCQRFGHFHPDYHKAKDEAEAFLKELKKHPKIRAYLDLEERLDYLLSEVSRTIARSVSDSIKVPINDPRELRRRRKGCG
ncbi:cell fate (sporulation/competence/biofilm development) regulator YlbF (YheA/YmcA/DUF963 family) [Melghirimyces profundicolus]|uniref:Cell fate (Sporulation/competence/biofilm development) regulator YlbF (YheA/YmcA/DUF963 family) n=1 Tax=Melghirimyces profundicolus TaxID=1242148 RepID=A0A2T6BQI0_9BACL|nr:YlbF family regulator [Melghirimyces profundicolus]PTX58296.1 cell fate (sporulation/competence/biofilm development) regulator YlbF (YheA/YmcA/DUF963 family) [Melghirimyces profundicolus]